MMLRSTCPSPRAPGPTGRFLSPDHHVTSVLLCYPPPPPPSLLRCIPVVHVYKPSTTTQAAAPYRILCSASHRRNRNRPATMLVLSLLTLSLSMFFGDSLSSPVEGKIRTA